MFPQEVQISSACKVIGWRPTNERDHSTLNPKTTKWKMSDSGSNFNLAGNFVNFKEPFTSEMRSV